MFDMYFTKVIKPQYIKDGTPSQMSGYFIRFHQRDNIELNTGCRNNITAKLIRWLLQIIRIIFLE
jgi:hypothetical protein